MLLAAALAVAVVAFGSTSRAASAPAAVSSSDWTSIRVAYEANRHAAFPIEGGHQARNPGQQWQTKFDGCGFTTQPDKGGWRWGLELRAYGFGDRKRMMHGSPEVKADGQRVTYVWDGNVQEWFVNDQRGLEHGFTVALRPPGTPEPGVGGSTFLAFDLIVRGTLRAEVASDGQGINFTDDKGTAMVTYAGLKVWDADGKVLPARLEIPSDAAGHSLRLSVDERDARYPLTVDPIAQQALLTASNAENQDRFGYAVAVSGDTVVVAAPGEDSGVRGDQSDNSAGDSGAAYVFVRNGQSWTQQAYLKGSNPMQFDVFGQSVAISGDIVVVGSHEIDFNTGLTGAAYVFVRSGTTWTQQGYLQASNAGVDDQFGRSVSVSGNYALVGAWGKDNEAGAAYVFVRNGTTWSEQAYLKASNTQAGIRFGWAVSISAETAVVGAYAESSNATGVNGNQNDKSANEAGAAYVFVRNGTTWSQQAYLKASNTDAGDRFGASVSVSGNTVVAGAYRERSNARNVNGNQGDNSAIFAGAAYVFVRNGTTWSYQAYLKASNADAVDEFGFSVAVSGDTAVVGAHFEDSAATGVDPIGNDNSASGAGAAYVFTRSGPIWRQEAYLKASDTRRDASFGEAVAVGDETVVIGAPFLPFVPESGTTYVFATVPGYRSFPRSGELLDCGSVFVGGDAGGAKLTISNTGAGNLRIESVGLGEGPEPDYLTIQPEFPQNIPGGHNLEVILVFRPTIEETETQGIHRFMTVRGDGGTLLGSHPVRGGAYLIGDSSLEAAFLSLLTCLNLPPPPGCPDPRPEPPPPAPAPAKPAGTRVTDDDTQTSKLVFNSGASQALTAELPSFLGGGSVQLSNFTGSVTVSLHPIPNDPDHPRIRIESGSMTAPSFQLPSGVETGLNRLTFGPPDASDGVLQVSDGTYTASAIATIVNDRFPDGIILRGKYSGVYDSQTGKITVQSQSKDLFPARGNLLNISTRMQVLTGDRVLIGGFIITGTEPKKVIIRGIGPSLGGAGAALSDPTLQLLQGSTTLATNDNWKTRSDGSTQQGEIEATTIPPTNDLESALVATLNPGTYTAILAGKGQASGLGVVEVYDLAQEASSKLANISSRGFVDTGDNIMIGGVIVGGGLGGGKARVLVRAIGPSLSGSGVSGALQDPTLELRDGNGTTISSNDNWKFRPDGSSQQAEIEATTIPPADARESALVASLPPGNHTAIVRGANNAIGIAVVEAYNIP
jgi:hypothetical protein